MFIILGVALLLLSAGLVVAIYHIVLRPRPSHGLSTATLTIASATLSVEIADTPLARIQGLSGRSSLKSDEGMLFLFSRAGKYGFWMKGMQFPIDIVWIREGHVLGVTQDVSLNSQNSVFSLPVYYPPGPVDMVLEINAGRAAALGISAGDSVSLQSEDGGL